VDRDEHLRYLPNQYFGTGTAGRQSSVFWYWSQYQYRQILVPVSVPIPNLVQVMTISMGVKVLMIVTSTKSVKNMGNRYRSVELVLLPVTSNFDGCKTQAVTLSDDVDIDTTMTMEKSIIIMKCTSLS
jgi:hypothetical protein